MPDTTPATPGKVYLVTDDTIYCYVRAESAGKARSAALRHDESDAISEYFPFFDVRRVPEYDDNGITEFGLIKDGRMWTDCVCGRRINYLPPHPDDSEDEREPFTAYLSPSGHLFCSESCYRDRLAAGKPVDVGVPVTEVRDGICLYPE